MIEDIKTTHLNEGRVAQCSEDLNRHPRDDNILFDPIDHSYTLKNDPTKELLSVTTFIKTLFHPFDSEAVVEKYYDSWQNKQDSRYFNMTKDAILRSWDVSNKRANADGTNMHENIERYYKGQYYSSVGKEWTYFKQFEHWYTTFNSPWTPYKCEWKIYHEELQLAGCIDMVYKNSKGEFILCDWKRCKKIQFNNRFQQGSQSCTLHLDDCNYVHYSLQLMIYAYILKHKYDIRVSSLIIINLHPSCDGFITYPVHFSEETMNDIMKHRALYL